MKPRKRKTDAQKLSKTAQGYIIIVKTKLGSSNSLVHLPTPIKMEVNQDIYIPK